MTQYWNHHDLKFVLSGILAKLAFLTELVLFAGNGDRAIAQIIPDNSLGNEASVVTPNVEIKGRTADRIDGGAIRDSNLFHSFQEFNIGDLQRVYFANPAGITNIFSRVTGSNLSEIFGTLGVNGNANLFLINPNGIIFGENASLDVGGSFAASTANAIQFGDRGFFSATEPEQPPLLTIKPSAFFFNQINPGRIENRSTAPAGVDLLGEPLSGLRVPDGQSLLLVGGDIAIDGGGLHAPGGQVELAGVAGSGTIGLNVDGSNLNLSFPEDIARADISLTNEAFVNTSGEGGGAIAVWGRQVKLSDGSQIAATTLGAKAGQGLVVNASESVELTGTTADKLLSSGLFTQTGGTGDAGDLTITTKHLRVENGARVLAGTFSQGNGGNLTVNASESVQIIGATGSLPFDNGSFSSSIQSNTGSSFGSRLFRSPLDDQTLVTGKGGNVTIITSQLQLLEGAQITATNRGDRDGGDLTVNASESVQVIGFDPVDGTSSGLFTQTQGRGNAGNIDITTVYLAVTNGAQVATFTEGEGNAGSVKINATDTVLFDGAGKQLFGPGGAFSRLSFGARGNAGNISITTGSLKVLNGAILSASTNGEGNAGIVTIQATESVVFDGEDIDGEGSGAFSQVRPRGRGNAGGISITTSSLEVTNGAELSVSTIGEGNAGSMTLTASEKVLFDGETSIGLNSGAFSLVDPLARGNAGSISITTGSLSVTNGAQVSASTRGEGNAGSVTIHAADSVVFEGESSRFGSGGALSKVQPRAVGNAGGVEISTGSLSVTNGAQVSASTLGEGKAGSIAVTANTLEATNGGQLLTSTSGSFNAGDITLKVTDSIILTEADSGLFASTTVGSSGQGGSIFIDPRIVVIRDGATISVNSQGEGTGGNIFLQADSLTLDNGASISAQTASNTGGDIALQMQDLLLLRNQSQISTTAGTAQAGGDGGDINIAADLIVAFPQENSDITANAFAGDGGNIQIDTENIFGFALQENSNLSDITASSEFGFDGTVNINTSGLEPGQESIALPIEIVDVSKLINRNLCSAGQEGEFIITGKGGLSPSPQDTLNTDAGWEDWRMVVNSESNHQRSPQSSQTRSLLEENYDDSHQIIEAQSWFIAPNGNIVLSAQPVKSVSRSSSFLPPNCQLLDEVKQ
ncbi:MAG: filamentous hemagglutinin N-terminal domain-containing protein [Pleurocapsa sp. MO_226.B13]|nr:filamentous hemagglutinin N-terminal domain-containing protein [Pleurocapsa sp. MO_226.B13]